MAQGRINSAWIKQRQTEVKTQDYVRRVITDSRNNAIVLASWHVDGGGRGFWLGKAAGSDGRLFWQIGNGVASDTRWNDVAVDAQDNIIVAGREILPGGTESCVAVAKYSSQGTLLWKVGREAALQPGSATAVKLDEEGNILVCGRADNPSSGSLYAAKFRPESGGLIWQTTAPFREGGGSALALDKAGNLFIAGSGGVIKLDGTHGRRRWKFEEGPYKAIAVDANGDVVAAGDRYYAYSEEGGQIYRLNTVKLNAGTGVKSWEKFLRQAVDSRATGIAFDSRNEVIVSGYACDISFNFLYYTAKYRGSNGAVVWEKLYDGGYIQQPYAFVVTKSDDVLPLRRFEWV